MLKKIFLSCLGGGATILIYLVYSNPGIIRRSFSWSVTHLFAVAGVIFSGLSLRALVGSKDVKKSIILQVAAIACIFNDVLREYGREVLWSLSMLIKR